ncbi:inorganic pyrophosphatase [Candidatus Kaiserbacteria bacterium RIFCSPHIGHO2_02_FULL_50_50]|uniref:inorganic diphosphatase n=1 Tax=Candidatus Kaiserbacteria bacterium RIFCSPHIGHO2_02_FULL_50_50 TaxID=1798492 RepID=A0A1F6DEH8_9BACT|nr:MAG: inorganic pyrophosphatase [Candidatus Kaiserbacteria bacterium RIFCSPHIGHO2_02_FULL_50_50]OGG88210.1 MAG: inorganic pyrophosphatase [Candidatus Kaiserbacteria bacterium RIFCSPLOWO2_12_FULL_50_10]
MEYLGKEVKVAFDRPLGSTHPKHGWVYEANYGYVPGVKAPDGDDLDVYYLGVTEPLQEAEGVCIAIIHRENDDDDKLIIVPKGVELTDAEIREATNFQEQWFKSRIVRN